MEKLITPFGVITILLDGDPIPYTAQEGRRLDALCPHVLGRYQIAVSFVPDGNEHEIACIFEAVHCYNSTPEDGEFMVCQSFYSFDRFKISIGAEIGQQSFDGVHISHEYDYDADHLENGMVFLIGPDTKTEQYVFGISWIDDVGWFDTEDTENDRSIETWYGADPGFSL